jgi:hypothetical protein
MTDKLNKNKQVSLTRKHSNVNKATKETNIISMNFDLIIV